MRTVFLILAGLGIFQVIARETAKQRAEIILKQFYDEKNYRYPTFLHAFQLMEHFDHHTIVETGTMRGGRDSCRGDGCSTLLFSMWASLRHNCTVDSVDILEGAVEKASNAIQDGGYGQTTIHKQDSVEFLHAFPKLIDFLYLDSFDYSMDKLAECQQHHLREIIAAYDKLHEKSVVMLDDCDLPMGGKCKLVELFLRQLGWKVIQREYQMILVPGSKIAKN